MSLEPKRAYKIVLIGDPEVGKTSIRRRYMGKTFKGEYLKTIGADFAAQKVEIEGETVLLTIWDLAGQSIFHGMRSSFYQGCRCALVVFDVTDKNTLTNATKWAEEASIYAKGSLKEIYIIGNKIDLESERVISAQDIEDFVNSIREKNNYPVRIYETSALTGENIQELFMNMSWSLIIGDDKSEETLGTDNIPLPDAKKVTSKAKHSVKTSDKKSDLQLQLPTIINEMENSIDKMEKLVHLLKKLASKEE